MAFQFDVFGGGLGCEVWSSPAGPDSGCGGSASAAESLSCRSFFEGGRDGGREVDVLAVLGVWE